MDPSIVKVSSPDDPRISVFSSLTERQLLQCSDSGLFIAESPKVIKVALEEGYQPEALLCEAKHITGDAAEIIRQCPGIPVYTGDREILTTITGYRLTRGVLCAMKRKPESDPELICKNAYRVAVIESVCDTTNIGSIFRSAAALGIDAILLTPDSCDPFNRRSIRVSMGTVFKIPRAFSSDPVTLLKSLGFITVALALHDDAVTIDSPGLRKSERIAMFLGTEGDGLSQSVISRCDYKAIIPMHNRVDSLNVGTAAAIAFWQLRRFD